MAGEIYFNNLTGQFDWGSIVDQIMKMKSLPLQRLQQESQRLQSLQESYSKVLNPVNSLKSLFDNLNLENLFNQKTAVSSNPNVLTATAGANTPNVSLNIQVNQLAQREMLVSTGGVSDLNQTISWNAFDIGLNTGSSVEWYGTVQSGSGTLQDLVNAINNLPNSKVQASVFFDGSTYRLLLSEKDEGASTFETSPGDTAILVNYSDPNTGFGSPLWFVDSASPLQYANNAKITVGSSTITSPTNTFNNLITGLSITVKDTGSATVEIKEDNTAISKFFQDLISKYNDIVKQVNELTGLDKPLQGDQMLLNVKRTLTSLLDPLFKKSLLNVDENGALSLDTLRLDSLISSDREGVKSLINSLNASFSPYLSNLSEDFNRIVQDYGQRIESINQRANTLYEQLVREESRLKLEFARLETFINQANDTRNRLQDFIVTLSQMQGGKR